MTAQEIMRILNLEPLPSEGGFFNQIYHAKVNVPSSLISPGSKDVQAICTSIYYLVVPGNFSALHRVKQDELFHFYSGGAVEMVQIDSKGALTKQVLGTDLKKGQRPLVVVPSGIWQGARLLPGAEWALLGTTCSPGFEDRDFELGKREELVKHFPKHASTIREFTR